MFSRALLLPLILAAQSCAQTAPQTLAPVAAQPAIDGMLEAFRTHPIVAIDDQHGLAQQLDFYAALIRDPRFASEVGNVVVEFGGSKQQAVIDRYVAGEDVPYSDLRKVWTDTVGWIPVVPYIGQINFFAHVRAANLGLPADRRIRVWLGEPPIEWSKVTTRADYIPLLRQRDDFPADLIQREILAKKHKALVIYGGGHLSSYESGDPNAKPHQGTEQAIRGVIADLALDKPTFTPLTPALLAELEQTFGKGIDGMRGMIGVIGPITSMQFRGADANGDDLYFATTPNSNLRTSIHLDVDGRASRFSFDPVTIPMAVEAAYPDAIFRVAAYAGFSGNACLQRFEDRAKAWPVPALAPLRGTLLAQDLTAPGCEDLPGGVPASDNPQGRAGLPGEKTADAILYLGPSGDLTFSLGLPDMYLDLDYRREIMQRSRVMRGMRVTPEPDMKTVTVAPRKWRPE